MFNRMLIFPELALGFGNVFTAKISRLRLHSKVMAQSFGACELDWQPKNTLISVDLAITIYRPGGGCRRSVQRSGKGGSVEAFPNRP